MAAAFAVSGCGDNIVPVPDAPPCMRSITDYGVIDTFASTTAVRTHDGAGKQTVAVLGALQPGPSADTLDIQLIQGLGAFGGQPPATGTYALTGAESQLATCGVCVVLEAGTPRAYFAAQRGKLVIEQIDTTFKASLSDAVLAHVEVDPTTSVSTIVDACQTTISASWETPIR